MPLVDRRFWVYDEPLESAAFNSAFAALAGEFAKSGAGPIGVAALIDDPAVLSSRREPVWRDTDLMFAGYLEDGRQLRIRYFRDAAIGPGLPDSPTVEESQRRDYSLEGDHRIERLADSADVTVDDVLALWQRENALAPEEALRRVHEVELVAVSGDEGVVGVSSAYLQRNARLRMDLWYYRTFVAESHRRSNVAAQLLFGTRDVLERRFTTGEDRRAGAMIFELENIGLMRSRNKAQWLRAGFTFIGENDYGHHVRIHYFEGAEVPPPPSA